MKKMQVLMVGRKKSIAYEELEKYWGHVDFIHLRRDKVLETFSKVPLRKYDLVIAQEPTLRVGAFAYLIAKICRAKLTVEIHGEYLGRWLKGVNKIVSTFIIKRADLIRAVNNKIAIQLEKMNLSRKVVVIPSIYVRTDILKPFKPHSERDNIILYAGRMTYEKNLPLLIEAFNHVVREDPSTKLYLIGKGPERNNIAKLIDFFKLERNIVLVDEWLPLKQLVKYYNDAAVFVLTSFYEGGPRVIFEAGACETPFVSTPVGILPEILEDGVGGFFIKTRNPSEIAEKILILLNDVKLREKMGRNLREIVIKNFEWNTAIRKYAESYIQFFSRR